MALEGWVEPISHYKAFGDVDASGRMTGADITDSSGTIIDRGRSFDSRSQFEAWAKSASGIG